VLEAVGKKKATYRKAALVCLEQLLSGFDAHDLFDQVWPMFSPPFIPSPQQQVYS
jgi:hypothetical protein